MRRFVVSWAGCVHSRVPRFIPKPSFFVEPEEYTAKPRVFCREAVDAMYFIWIVDLLEILENLIDMRFCLL